MRSRFLPHGSGPPDFPLSGSPTGTNTRPSAASRSRGSGCWKLHGPRLQRPARLRSSWHAGGVVMRRRDRCSGRCWRLSSAPSLPSLRMGSSCPCWQTWPLTGGRALRWATWIWAGRPWHSKPSQPFVPESAKVVPTMTAVATAKLPWLCGTLSPRRSATARASGATRRTTADLTRSGMFPMRRSPWLRRCRSSSEALARSS
mmetsp:Transcript_27392/g.59831  ORF Transcript_27392/g.59831 Transcript_27392/m.59831 type:complete len:202 (-) Transcript_27392:1802-2407(-)